jgi:hypothetical protein
MGNAVIYNNIKKEVKMPGFNKKGPEGLGPLTGRRMGQCAGNENESAGFGYGRGFGRGRRRGFGRGFGFFGFGRNRNLPEDESIESDIELLKNQISLLEKKLGKRKKSD